MKREEILQEIEEASEVIADYNKMHFLNPSTEEGKKALAKINLIIQKIKFLLKMQDLRDIEIDASEPYFRKPLFGGKPGALVAVKPVEEKYEDKTYIGFLIGDIATSVSLSRTEEKMIVKFDGKINPCIFIPETGTVVMGYESWWHEIKSEDEFRKITDQDIQNTWYVKLWKEMKDIEKVENADRTPEQEKTT